MAIKHFWLHTNRIFYVLLEGALSEAEILESDERVANIFSTIDQDEPRYLHVILDHQGITHAPDLKTLIRVTTGTDARRRMGKAIRSGWTIDIGIPMQSMPLLKFFQAVSAQKNNLHYRQFETIEQAIEFLQIVDERLPLLEVLSVEHMTPAGVNGIIASIAPIIPIEQKDRA